MVNPHDKKYASLVKYAEGVCRGVGIRYGMAHCEIKAPFDEKLGRWVNPAMIEVGARLAGGRKAVMAEATVSLNMSDLTLKVIDHLSYHSLGRSRTGVLLMQWSMHTADFQ
jgi:hypothetical protein